MRFKKRYKTRNKINLILSLFIFMFIISLSIGYSSLNQELNITSDASFRVEEDVRITDIKLVGNTFNGLENYNSSYSKDSIKTGITLNENTSTITYLVTITNLGNVPVNLVSLENKIYNNENITYEINQTMPYLLHLLSLLYH